MEARRDPQAQPACACEVPRRGRGRPDPRRTPNSTVRCQWREERLQAPELPSGEITNCAVQRPQGGRLHGDAVASTAALFRNSIAKSYLGLVSQMIYRMISLSTRPFIQGGGFPFVSKISLTAPELMDFLCARRE